MLFCYTWNQCNNNSGLFLGPLSWENILTVRNPYFLFIRKFVPLFFLRQACPFSRKTELIRSYFIIQRHKLLVSLSMMCMKIKRIQPFLSLLSQILVLWHRFSKLIERPRTLPALSSRDVHTNKIIYNEPVCLCCSLVPNICRNDWKPGSVIYHLVNGQHKQWTPEHVFACDCRAITLDLQSCGQKTLFVFREIKLGACVTYAFLSFSPPPRRRSRTHFTMLRPSYIIHGHVVFASYLPQLGTFSPSLSPARLHQSAAFS